MISNDNYQRDFEQFLDSYRFNKNKPLKTLFYLYRGNVKRLLISSLFFLIKHSPVWIIPVVTANIINIASQPSKHSIAELWINLGIAALGDYSKHSYSYVACQIFQPGHPLCGSGSARHFGPETAAIIDFVP